MYFTAADYFHCKEGNDDDRLLSCEYLVVVSFVHNLSLRFENVSHYYYSEVAHKTISTQT